MTPPAQEVVGRMLHTLGPVGTATGHCHPWAITLARRGEQVVFRAKLMTRSSTVSDVELLGRLVKLAGAPAGAPSPASLVLSPAGPHEWAWTPT